MKQTFGANTFAAQTFLSETLRGVSGVVPVILPKHNINLSAHDAKVKTFIARDKKNKTFIARA